jgi:hypothetical protein
VITSVVLVGIQSAYRLDTTCGVALEFGYRVVVPACGHTIFDNGGLTATQIHTVYHERILAGRFAEMVPIEVALGLLGGGDAAP